MKTLKTHSKVDESVKRGSRAIYNMTAGEGIFWGGRPNRQQFLALGARAVLVAIVADLASSAEAKSEARDALGKLA